MALGARPDDGTHPARAGVDALRKIRRRPPSCAGDDRREARVMAARGWRVVRTLILAGLFSCCGEITRARKPQGPPSAAGARVVLLRPDSTLRRSLAVQLRYP